MKCVFPISLDRQVIDTAYANAKNRNGYPPTGLTRCCPLAIGLQREFNDPDISVGATLFEHTPHNLDFRGELDDDAREVVHQFDMGGTVEPQVVNVMIEDRYLRSPLSGPHSDFDDDFDEDDDDDIFIDDDDDYDEDDDDWYDDDDDEDFDEEDWP